MERGIQAIIFDMDGLMFDTEPLFKTAWQKAAQELGYFISDALFYSLIGKNKEDSENIVLEALGKSFPVAQFREVWPKKWREQVTSNLPLKKGLLELLSFLDSKSVSYGVATSSDQEDAYFVLNRSGMIERFQCIVAGDQVQSGKPAPDIYLKAAQKLNASPIACFALEDSNAGAKAAINAGISTIVVPDIVEPTEEIVSLSYAIVPSLIEARKILETLI